jgi:flagellar biosynthesis GTPase FlhF
MRLKSYFSGTVEAAMALARKEMGDDAMLIHSRPAQPEARHLGAYEVVFGTYGASGSSPDQENAAEPREERPGPVAVAKRVEPSSPEDALAQQVGQLRREMERMLESLVRQNSSVSLRMAEETGLSAPVLERVAAVPATPRESVEDSL